MNLKGHMPSWQPLQELCPFLVRATAPSHIPLIFLKIQEKPLSQSKGPNTVWRRASWGWGLPSPVRAVLAGARSSQ